MSQLDTSLQSRVKPSERISLAFPNRLGFRRLPHPLMKNPADIPRLLVQTTTGHSWANNGRDCARLERMFAKIRAWSVI